MSIFYISYLIANLFTYSSYFNAKYNSNEEIKVKIHIILK